jgi:hypothetical protein
LAQRGGAAKEATISLRALPQSLAGPTPKPACAGLGIHGRVFQSRRCACAAGRRHKRNTAARRRPTAPKRVANGAWRIGVRRVSWKQRGAPIVPELHPTVLIQTLVGVFWLPTYFSSLNPRCRRSSRLPGSIVAKGLEFLIPPGDSLRNPARRAAGPWCLAGSGSS